MEIKSWPTGVNKIVTSETSVEIGTNAVKSETSENGSEQSCLNASSAPDVYSVQMWFSNSTSDSFYLNHVGPNGAYITEWNAFLNFIKYTLAYGTNPFYFADLDDPTGLKKAIYKIRSSGLPKGTPNGEYVHCTMTWERVYNDYITVTEPDLSTDTLDCTNGQFCIVFNKEFDSDKSVDFVFSANAIQATLGSTVISKEVTWFDFDGYKTLYIYFDDFTDSGTYTNIKVSGQYYYVGSSTLSSFSIGSGSTDNFKMIVA